MLDAKNIREAAQRPQAAETGHVQLRQLHLDFPSMTLQDAYAIQREWVAMKLAAGRRVRGHKIGLTSRAMPSRQSVQARKWDCPHPKIVEDFYTGQEGRRIPGARGVDSFEIFHLHVALARILHNAIALSASSVGKK